MPHICHICQIVHMQIWNNYFRIYASDELSAIYNVVRKTVIILLSLLTHAHEEICLPHCIYMSPYMSSIAYTSTQHYCTYQLKKWTKKCNYNLYCFCHICARKKYGLNAICPSNSMWIYGEVCKYICYLWTQWHQPCDQECCTHILITMTMMIHDNHDTDDDGAQLLDELASSKKLDYMITRDTIHIGKALILGEQYIRAQLGKNNTMPYSKSMIKKGMKCLHRKMMMICRT